MYVTAPSFVPVIMRRLCAVVCMYILYICMYGPNSLQVISHCIHFECFFFFPPSAIESVITRGASFVYCHVQEGTGD